MEHNMYEPANILNSLRIRAEIELFKSKSFNVLQCPSESETVSGFEVEYI